LKHHEEQMAIAQFKELNKRFNQWFDKEDKSNSSLGVAKQLARSGIDESVIRMK